MSWALCVLGAVCWLVHRSYLFTRFGQDIMYVHPAVADVIWVASGGLLTMSAGMYVP